jgi:hypothetical protein
MLSHHLFHIFGYSQLASKINFRAISDKNVEIAEQC